jgi:hypothetical protein
MTTYHDLSLTIELGNDSEILFYALTNRKAHLHEEASIALARKDIDSYLQYHKEACVLKEIIDALFLQMNQRLAPLPAPHQEEIARAKHDQIRRDICQKVGWAD